MYGIENRSDLLKYIDAVFMPLARPAAASDVIVNIAGFGTSNWDDPDGVCEGLKQIVMGPKCINVNGHGFKCGSCGFDIEFKVLEVMGTINYCPICGSEITKYVDPDSGKTCGE